MAEKTLIIDDDPETLRLVGLMLQREGYQTITSTSGAEGLGLAEAQLPDVILLDMMMPQMDGCEVARRLRNNPVTSHIPILMFTARGRIEDRVAGMESGADAYLTKPARPSELQTQVRALLGRARERSAHVNAPAESLAHGIGVLGIRPGSGVTTVALNLAASLSQVTVGEVVLAELRPGQGRIRHDLNLSEQRNLADLLGLPAGEISRSRVGETLITYSGGLRLLLPSNELSELKLAAHATQFESLAQRLAFMAQFVIYDFGAGMNGSSSPLARTFCRELIVVVEPARAAIMQAWAMFEELARLGIGRERILCVANYRASGSHVLDPEQLQDQVGRPLAAVIPPAAETLALARREHVIPVLMRPEPSMRQHFVALAQQVMAQAPSAHR